MMNLPRSRNRDALLGIHHVVVTLVFLRGLEVVVILILVIVYHLISLSGLEIDLSTAGTAAAMDDVRRVDLGKIVLFDVYLLDRVRT